MKILIADDDELVRAIVERVVAQFDHTLIEAEDGLQALRMIEQHDPDVLITDLRMPVLDGVELVTAVRSSPLYRGLPVVCLSAVKDRDEVAQLAALGITDYLLKPIRPRDLSDRLQAVTARHANWKLERNPSAADATAPIVLVIDPDASFRSFVGSTLAPDFLVVGAASGASGVTMFKDQGTRIAAVLVSEGLDLLDEVRTAGLLKRLASEQNIAPPTVLLVSTVDAVDPDKAAAFDAAIRRSTVAADFRAAAMRSLRA